MAGAAPLIVYVRVSRKGDREDERFHSPREQEERARAHAAAKGLAAGEVIADIDVSGGTHPTERPGMARALELVRAGKAGGLVAFSLDRFSRDPAHGDWLVREVTGHGGIVAAPDMPEDITTPTGEFTFGMLLGVARLYRRTAGDRLDSAKERAIRAGIPVGPVPFGYRQRPDRTLERDPKAARTVRRLYERRVAGASWTDLARLLDEATGRTWTRQAARGMLANRIYATGRLSYGREGAKVVSEHDAGAIVDEALWHAAQRAEAPRPARNGDGGWLLTGLVRCGACGNALVPWTGARRRRRDPRRGKMEWVEVKNPPRRYKCTNRACGAGVSVHAGLLERFVVAQSFALGDEVQTRGEAADLRALEDALADAERRVEQVMAEGVADDLGELWAPEVRRRREARDAAAAALGQARAEAGVPVLELHLATVWEDMSPADRRAALALYWKAVHVGAKGKGGRAVRLVARGPGAEVGVALKES